MSWNEVNDMNLIQMSISAAAGVTLILLLRILFFHHLSKKVFVVLWSVIILRLIIPVSLPAFSGLRIPIVNEIQKKFFLQDNMDVVLKSADVMVSGKNEGEHNLSSSLTGENGMDNHISQIQDISQRMLKKRAIIWCVWGTGLLLSFICFAVGYYKESSLLAQSLPISEEDKEYFSVDLVEKR